MSERPTADKFSHKEVKYERTSEHPAQYCANCKHVIEASGGTRCEAVKSPIYLSGWCVRWSKK